MQVVVSKKAKRMLLLFICVFLLVMAIINIGGYVFNMKYVSVLAALAEVNKYEVRSQLLMEAMDEVGVSEPQQVPQVWASGLINRSAALQYSVMSDALKLDYAKQLTDSTPNWVTGMSSPWVDRYEIIETVMPNEYCFIFHLKLYTKTSSGPDGEYGAVLTVAREGNFWRIAKLTIDAGLYPYTGFVPQPDTLTE